MEYAEKVWQIEQSYIESLKSQKKYSEIISRFSPISLYELLVLKLSGTDIYNFERFIEQTKEYRNGGLGRDCR